MNSFLAHINNHDIDKMIAVRDQLRRTLRVVITTETRTAVREALEEAENYINNYQQLMFEDEDPELVELYHRDQRRLYAGPARHTCPTCGRDDALTDEQKRRGYHCDDCTKEAEL